MPPKPTLKDRVGQATANAQGQPQAKPSVPTGPLGIRQRLGATSSSSTEPPGTKLPQTCLPKANIRKRVHEATSHEEQGGAASSTDSPSSAKLLRLLKKEWAVGTLPSWKIQAFAEAAASGGVTDLGKLPDIASGGKFPANAQRDLMRAWGTPNGAPPLVWFPIPAQDNNGETTVVNHPFVLPHKMFESLYHSRREMFQKSVAGNADDREALWHHLAPQVQAHPHLANAGTENCVPLGLHGDGGSLSKQEGLFVLTWNSILGEGVTMETRFVITLIKKSQMLANGATLMTIFQIIAWSMNAILLGKHPNRDPFDVPVDGGGGLLANDWLEGGRSPGQRRLAVLLSGLWVWGLE